MSLKHEPEKPTNSNVNKAYAVLLNARKVANSFKELFEWSRKSRKSAGTSTDQEQDLLRAMLTFASSGLDAMVKQLIKDALPKIVQSNEGAHGAFVEYIERRLKREGDKSVSLIATLIADKSPRDRLIRDWVKSLTDDSMQSFEQLSKVAASFDIPTITLTNQPEKVKNVFKIRNQISHEMDIDFSKNNRSRRPRARKEMVKATEELFDIANNFLAAVDKRLSTN